MAFRVYDRASTRVWDDSGALKAGPSVLTRAMVSRYYGHEMGLAPGFGLDPARQYRVLRPREELIKALPRFQGLKLMDGHQDAKSDTYAPSGVVGAVTGPAVMGEDDAVRAPVVIWPGRAVQSVQDGSQDEFSVGYDFDIDPTPGIYKGQEYDLRMTNLRPDHVAVVPKGRVNEEPGPKARVEDALKLGQSLPGQFSSGQDFSGQPGAHPSFPQQPLARSSGDFPREAAARGGTSPAHIGGMRAGGTMTGRHVPPLGSAASEQLQKDFSNPGEASLGWGRDGGPIGSQEGVPAFVLGQLYDPATQLWRAVLLPPALLEGSLLENCHRILRDFDQDMVEAEVEGQETPSRLLALSGGAGGTGMLRLTPKGAAYVVSLPGESVATVAPEILDLAQPSLTKAALRAWRRETGSQAHARNGAGASDGGSAVPAFPKPLLPKPALRGQSAGGPVTVGQGAEASHVAEDPCSLTQAAKRAWRNAPVRRESALPQPVAPTGLDSATQQAAGSLPQAAKQAWRRSVGARQHPAHTTARTSAIPQVQWAAKAGGSHVSASSLSGTSLQKGALQKGGLASQRAASLKAGGSALAQAAGFSGARLENAQGRPESSASSALARLAAILSGTGLSASARDESGEAFTASSSRPEEGSLGQRSASTALGRLAAALLAQEGTHSPLARAQTAQGADSQRRAGLGSHSAGFFRPGSAFARLAADWAAQGNIAVPAHQLPQTRATVSPQSPLERLAARPASGAFARLVGAQGGSASSAHEGEATSIPTLVASLAPQRAERFSGGWAEGDSASGGASSAGQVPASVADTRSATLSTMRPSALPALSSPQQKSRQARRGAASASAFSAASGPAPVSGGSASGHSASVGKGRPYPLLARFGARTTRGDTMSILPFTPRAPNAPLAGVGDAPAPSGGPQHLAGQGHHDVWARVKEAARELADEGASHEEIVNALTAIGIAADDAEDAADDGLYDAAHGVPDAATAEATRRARRDEKRGRTGTRPATSPLQDNTAPASAGSPASVPSAPATAEDAAEASSEAGEGEAAALLSALERRLKVFLQALLKNGLPLSLAEALTQHVAGALASGVLSSGVQAKGNPSPALDLQKAAQAVGATSQQAGQLVNVFSHVFPEIAANSASHSNAPAAHGQGSTTDAIPSENGGSQVVPSQEGASQEAARAFVQKSLKNGETPEATLDALHRLYPELGAAASASLITHITRDLTDMNTQQARVQDAIREGVKREVDKRENARKAREDVSARTGIPLKELEAPKSGDPSAVPSEDEAASDVYARALEALGFPADAIAPEARQDFFHKLCDRLPAPQHSNAAFGNAAYGTPAYGNAGSSTSASGYRANDAALTSPQASADDLLASFAP